MKKHQGRLAAAAFACAAVWIGAPASAAVVYGNVAESFDTAPISISFAGSTFTFSSTGDPFNPTAIQTSGGGEVNSFGGFSIFPLQPTSDFINRNTVTFGPGDQFSPFPTATTIPYSNSYNYIGLEAVLGSEDYYGFAFTTDTTLNSYGFETMPGVSITATTAVPEPTTWALAMLGIVMVGGALRYRRGRTAVAVASL